MLRLYSDCTNSQICLRPATLLKKRLWRRCFPVNFVKFLRTPLCRTPPVAASRYGCITLTDLKLKPKARNFAIRRSCKRQSNVIKRCNSKWNYTFISVFTGSNKNRNTYFKVVFSCCRNFRRNETFLVLFEKVLCKFRFLKNICLLQSVKFCINDYLHVEQSSRGVL